MLQDLLCNVCLIQILRRLMVLKKHEASLLQYPKQKILKFVIELKAII